MVALTTQQRPWTLMIYMAGDNGRIFETSAGPLTLMAEMTSAGYRDVWEMGQVGTTDACAVTCLFDTQEAAYLVEVRKGRGMSDSIVRPLREVNTGEPGTLSEFINRSAEEYPAERYGLVLWNHGTGWLDEDPYERVRAVRAERPSLFRRDPPTTRPIALDDTSRDFLDTGDLHTALVTATRSLARRLDVIGMDACLMAMIEGVRELTPFTGVFVASQEVEPMAGWPYARILRRINAEPDMSGEELGVAIVEEFTGSYQGSTRSDTVTQSAVATDRCQTTESLCKELVRAIMSHRSPAVQASIRQARDQALAFQDRDFRDLGDFAARVAEEAEWAGLGNIATAAGALHDHLVGRGRNHPVLCLGSSQRYASATGLSVYLPSVLPAHNRDVSMKPYRRLSFAQDAGWDFLVEWLSS